MVEWLNNHKIMEQIYVQSIHQEMLKRAVDIAKFFAIQNQIQNHHIDLMWSATIVILRLFWWFLVLEGLSCHSILG